MSADELAEAVRLPAAAVGVEVEPALVDRIVAEAELQPGRAAARAAHAGRAVRASGTTNAITLADFDEAGGLAGAIGRRAEAIYESFDERRARRPRQVFLRLVSVSEEHEDTRRRVRRTELEQAGIARRRSRGRARRVRPPPAADVRPRPGEPDADRGARPRGAAHRMGAAQGWVDEAREDLLTRRRVESAARDWIDAGSDASFLYGGGRLELAESWARQSRFELTDDERRFLAASRDRVDRDARRACPPRRRIIALLVSASPWR